MNKSNLLNILYHILICILAFGIGWTIGRVYVIGIVVLFVILLVVIKIRGKR